MRDVAGVPEAVQCGDGAHEHAEGGEFVRDAEVELPADLPYQLGGGAPADGRGGVALVGLRAVGEGLDGRPQAGELVPGVVLDGGQDLPGGAHGHPADLDQRPDQPQPPQMLLVVLGLGRGDPAARRQQPLAQVVLCLLYT